MTLFTDCYTAKDEDGNIESEVPYSNGVFPGGGNDLFGDDYITKDEGSDDDRDASKHHQINVVRRVYEQDTLNKDADYRMPRKTLLTKCKKLMIRLGYKSCLRDALPIIRWLPRYSFREFLLADMIAGATSAVMHIPQGMAYALLAEVPPIIGLYMAFFPVLVYVFFGTSPHISMGTFAVSCLMTGKVVMELTKNTTDVIFTLQASDEPPEPGVYTPVEIASAICFAVGCIQLIMWIFRLGMLSTLLSEPLVSGFTCAASIHVIASQLKEFFGISIPKYSGNYKVIITLIEVAENITNINWVTFGIAVATSTVLFTYVYHIKPKYKSRVPIPIELIVIVLGTLTARYGHLNENYGVKIVGNIPTGLPYPTMPRLELLSEVFVDAFIITMVTYSITMSMALIFAEREKIETDPNQELLAMGASNIFASAFFCAPFCASISRSYIQYQAGSKTGLTSVVSATLILSVLLWIGPFFTALPHAVLASIIFVALSAVVLKITEIFKFWKLSILDAAVWIITFLTTLLVNIDVGLLSGILASVGTLFCRSQKPYTCLLGRVPNTDIYLDIKRYRAAEEIPGIKIFHYCGGLNFASKNVFRNSFYRKVGCMTQIENTSMHEMHHDDPNDDPNRTHYRWDPTIANKVQCVILDASALAYVDAPGVKTLVTVQNELVKMHINVLLSGASAPVLEMIDTYNHIESEKCHMQTFPTVHDAIVFYTYGSYTDLAGSIHIKENSI